MEITSERIIIKNSPLCMEELSLLENEFRINQHPSKERITEIAFHLRRNRIQIQRWFNDQSYYRDKRANQEVYANFKAIEILPKSKPCHRLLTCHICYNVHKSQNNPSYTFMNFSQYMEHYRQLHNIVIELMCQCGASFLQGYELYDHECIKKSAFYYGRSVRQVLQIAMPIHLRLLHDNIVAPWDPTVDSFI